MSADDWPVSVDPVFRCWRWTGRKDAGGYGRSGSRLAHHVVFEAETGQAIPEGLEYDHTCRVRSCCSPAHGELVTREENVRRRSWRYRVRIERCKAGHLLKETAMITTEGGRCYRTCSMGGGTP